MADYLILFTRHLNTPLPLLHTRFAPLLLQLFVGLGWGGGCCACGGCSFFLFFFQSEILFDLTATQKSHYLSPHLAGAADNAGLCRCLADRRPCLPLWTQQIKQRSRRTNTGESVPGRESGAAGVLAARVMTFLTHILINPKAHCNARTVAWLPARVLSCGKW